MRSLRLLLALSAAALLAPSAYAQFFVTVQENGQTIVPSVGANIPFNAPAVGQSVTANFSITYLGLGSVVFPSAASIIGAGNFTGSAPGVTLTQGQSAKFDIVYTPKDPNQSLSQFFWPYNIVNSATPPVTTGTGVVVFGLVGTAPNVVLGQGSATGSFITVPNGGTVQFPNTPVNATSTVSLAITNPGSGPATISSIVPPSAGFVVLGIPLLPLTLNAGSQLNLTAQFTPTAIGPATGSLQIGVGSGAAAVPYIVTLAGTGQGAALSYQLTQGGSTVPLAGNQTIAITDTQVGSKNSATITFQNTAATAFVLTNIAINGVGFSITDAPFLPLTLQPQQSSSVTITYSPTQPGPSTGRLIIGTDTFPLSSNGLGSQFLFSYLVGSSNLTVPAGGVITLPTIAVGQAESIPFTVTNNGTSPGTIVSIGVLDTTGVFRIATSPNLPLQLGPNETATFSISFVPRTAGQAATTLIVNNQTFTVSGFSSSPPQVPSFSFTGASGVQQPFQQPSIGLSLNAPYPLGLTGTLTLSVNSSSFASDPAIVFSSGSRIVPFSIPPNSLNAVFSNGATQVKLQTGTVASVLTITASLLVNGADVTPGGAPTLQLTIPALAPVLLNATLASRSLVGFTISIAGFSTTRVMNSLTFQFTPAGGSSSATTTATVDVSAAAKLFFQTNASQNLGGQFTLDVPFILGNGGTVSSGTDLTKSITAVSVTASNDIGASNTLKVVIP